MKSLLRITLFVAASLMLFGCGPALGRRVDFGMDFANLEDYRMRSLAGQTFYITNEDDYQNLVALKRDLRDYRNAPTPTLFLQRDAMAGIAQITSKYRPAFTGVLYPWK